MKMDHISSLFMFLTYIYWCVCMTLPFHRGQTNMTYRGSAWGGKDKVDEANRSLMEQENDRKWEELGAKVSSLKMLSSEINKEVEDQNRLLDGMGSSFSSATDLFTTTIGKLGSMITTGNSNHMYYLILFVVVVFIFIYLMMRK